MATTWTTGPLSPGRTGPGRAARIGADVIYTVKQENR